jgi:hypothetical protein
MVSRKTIIAMPYALAGGGCGETQIVSRGLLHRITFSADAVHQVPRIDHETAPAEGEFGKNGTRIEVHWPDTASHHLDGQEARFLQICAGYAALNPHLSLMAKWDGEIRVTLSASDEAWPKWRACDPTSAYWYTPQRLARYGAAHVARDEDLGRPPRTVREFIGEFRGLSGSGKQRLVIAENDLARQPLAALFNDSAADEARITALLAAMKRHTRPVRPRDLGVIGSDHLLRFCKAAGGIAETFRYRLITAETPDGIPYVIESAFAAVPDKTRRRLVLGVNFAAALGNPFRSFRYDYHDGLETQLAEQRCGRDEPVVMILHLACARVEYQDRGKTAVVLHAMIARAINTAIDNVTSVWAKQRKAEERHRVAETKRWVRLTEQAEREREHETREEKEKPEPTGILGEKLASEAAAIEVSPETLSVLTVAHDPYLQWKKQREATWFAEHFNRLAPTGEKHLRGLFYTLVMMPEGIRRPDGSDLVNDYKCWSWLQAAAKAARWLGLVAFDRIVDERNAKEEIYVPGVSGLPVSSSLSSGTHCEIPNLDSLLPRFQLTGFSARQPNRLVFFGEKSSLAAILRPLAEAYGAEMILPTGESSNTRVAELAVRAAQDNRPTKIFYFSDFDPAGFQMPISVARQLHALNDLHYSGRLDIEVRPTALTFEQVTTLGLPSAPIKPSEKRAPKWREAWSGAEQTEIDALIELAPNDLRRIVREAVRPYFDFTLANRLQAAESAWFVENETRLEAHPGYKNAQRRIAAALKRVQTAVAKLSGEQNGAWRALNEVVTPPPPVPQPVIETKPAGPPLFDSKDDFISATRRLQRHRAYQGVAAANSADDTHSDEDEDEDELE